MTPVSYYSYCTTPTERECFVCSRTLIAVNRHNFLKQRNDVSAHGFSLAHRVKAVLPSPSSGLALHPPPVVVVRCPSPLSFIEIPQECLQHWRKGNYDDANHHHAATLEMKLGCGGACGRTLSQRLGRQTERGKNIKNKQMGALVGHQLTNLHTTTNQT